VWSSRPRYRSRHRSGNPGPAVPALCDRAQERRPGARPRAGPPGRDGSRGRHVDESRSHPRRLLLFPPLPATSPRLHVSQAAGPVNPCPLLSHPSAEPFFLAQRHSH
jgi:hypothetical protein